MAQQALVHQQNLWKTFFIFLLPLVVTNILQSLSGTINTVLSGKCWACKRLLQLQYFSRFCSV